VRHVVLRASGRCFPRAGQGNCAVSDPGAGDICEEDGYRIVLDGGDDERVDHICHPSHAVSRPVPMFACTSSGICSVACRRR